MDLKKYFVAVLLFGLLAYGRLEAQQKYWIYLNDENTGLNISRTLTSGKSLVSLNGTPVAPVVYSEWLNAFTAVLNEEEVVALENMGIIDSVRLVNRNYVFTSLRMAPKLEPYALNQINAQGLVDAGYNARGVKVGIIDAGFYRADKQRSLKPLITNGQFRGYRNYIEKRHSDPFSIRDSHGTRVWMLIGGHLPSERVYYGVATQADYFIARTDEEPSEYRAEEDYWIAALEWMHAEGVRIINSSLGYSDGHDNPLEDYRPEEADGKSSALTRAVNIAVFEKGLLIIMSAGNSGDESFEVVNIPSDSPGVIAVGSSNMKFWTKQDYSSIGRHTHPTIKPDVVCYSSDGTSFSAPVIAGLAACIMGADSSLSNLDVAALIRKSGNLRYFPNNYIGYGVPDAERILDMMTNSWSMGEKSGQLITDKDVVELSITAKNPVLFDKINDWEVIDQRTIQRKGSEWIIRRPGKEVKRTTFATKHEAIEIIWKD